jgi:NTE family protein
MAKRTKKKQQLNLGLQGGGAHGAFTWGVLDRLLEEEDIDIVGMSGTSAGAMNAAVLLDGMVEGGRDHAKSQLAYFWQEIARIGALFNPAPAMPFQGYAPTGLGLDWLAGFNPVDMLTRTFSPYELNPLNINPLRTVLEHVLKVENLHNHIKLFVSATNVETGQPRIFKSTEITIDVLLASACLPFIFQAVEIEGVPYWDGGYMGNPAIWPLIYQTDCHDVLLVQLNPIVRPGVPKNASDIINRLNEITFNSSLIAEMRAINFVKKLIQEGKLDRAQYRDMHMHLVAPPDGVHDMNASSKMNTDWQFFQMLHQLGRQEMERWIKKHKKDIGQRSTMSIDEHFLVKHRRCESGHAQSTLKNS